MNKDIKGSGALPTTAADKNRERLKNVREAQLGRKEAQINKMADEDVITELKAKGLPVFGTKQERIDRLKKYHGVGGAKPAGGNLNDSQDGEMEPEPAQSQSQPQPPAPAQPALKKKPTNNVVDNIEKMEQARKERRAKMEEMKAVKAEKEAENKALGKAGDVDFQLMIEKHRYKTDVLQLHTTASKLRICICVRKRPLFKKEETSGEIDAISVANPEVKVHECKFKVDGITKYIDNHIFQFDNAFSEKEPTEDVYKFAIRPLIEFILNEGIVTCFAYGQTGSGKTFTMRGIQDNCIEDLYKMASEKFAHLGIKFSLSFFEIYGGRCFDLLNDKAPLTILEDKNNEVQIPGIIEREAGDPAELKRTIEFGNSVRTTHATVSNDTSSRSHAICQIFLRGKDGRVIGKLLLVDLAGSERAQDTQSNNRQRRLEGAEINKSLLALKECIRAMDDNNRNGAGNHVPFRASKLTMVLRDSFVTKSRNSRIVMIACLAPGSSSADHTINTLRYSDRLKDRGTTEKEIELDYTEDPNFFEERKDAPPLQPQVQQRAPSAAVNGHNNGNGHAPVERQASSVQPNHQQKPSGSGMQPPAPQSAALHKQNSKGDIRSNPPQPHPKEENPNRQKENSQQGGPAAGRPPVKSAQPAGGVPPKAPAQKNQPTVADQGRQAQPPVRDDIEEDIDDEERIKKSNDDLKFMKKTMKLDEQKEGNEFFDFHEKMNKIIEHQEELFVTHMSAIKKDAALLTEESDLIANVQQMGEMEQDIDMYISKLEDVVKKKLHMYNILNKRVQKFKELLKEEEEMSSKVKSTFYY